VECFNVSGLVGEKLKLKKTILFVVNVDWFFVSHRLPIALEALKQGYEVHIATEITDRLRGLEGYGLIVHPIVFNRGKVSLSGEFLTFIRLWKLFKLIKPDVVHLVTIKPILLGGLAARLSRQKSVVAAVSGLGLVFTASGLWGVVRCWLAGNVYKLAFRHPNLKAIFQNSDDRERIVKLTHLPDSKLELIHGSGVDLAEYVNKPLPGGVPIVVFAARFLGDKGIREFIQAAISLRLRGVRARFCLVGSIDSANPNSVTDEELMKWSSDGIVESAT
jgi:glycosyltransferase involved in cell wall biosynthesis